MTYPEATQPRRPVCGAMEYLPFPLLPVALKMAPAGTADKGDVLRELICALERHEEGDHYAFVMEIDGKDTGSVWARWLPEARPVEVLALPDCEASEPLTGEPCCGFTPHPGEHTFGVADPWFGGA